MAVLRFDLRWHPGFAPVRLIEGSLSRAYGVRQLKARKSGAVLPQCNFSYEKEPQLRLPLSELSAPCEVLLARRSEFKENAVRGGSHAVEIVVDRLTEGVLTAFRGHVVVARDRLSCKLSQQSNSRKERPSSCLRRRRPPIVDRRRATS